MLPRTHEAILHAALARSRSAWNDDDLPALLRGHRDEDDLVVLGVRLRAPGLTHTYRPGRRFGELFAPSAKSKMLRCIRRANVQTARIRAAWWLGRACHLLGDMAVPARTRGVWHLAGDPLETWLEARPEMVGVLAGGMDVEIAPEAPGDLADGLARASSGHDADTTRTPWGRLSYERMKKGKRLYEADVEAQARALVPLAVAYTAALLEAVPPRGRP